METVIENAVKQVIIIQPTIDETASKRVKNVAAYARVSTDKDDQENSFEAQCNHFTDKIAKNPDWKLVRIFADEGISGTMVKKRADFMMMIEMCRKGKIDLILAKSISRFARNTLDCLNYVRELKSLGIAVYFEKENLNTLDDTKSEMMFTLLSCFAQAESESISQNVTWGVRQGYRQGKVSLNYTHLLGYKKGEDGKPEIVESEAEIVRDIFKKYLDGMSLIQISDGLNRAEIPDKQGKIQWSPNKVRRILECENFKGDVLRQKTYTVDCLTHKTKRNHGEIPMYLIKNNHDAIVGRYFFDKVQEEISRRNSRTIATGKRGKTKNGKYSAKYSLTELLRCAECGTPYRRVTWTIKGEKSIVWRCISRLENGKKYCKKSPTICENKLHDAIVNAINEYFTVKNEVAEILKTNLKSVITDENETIEAAEKQIAALQNETRKLVEQCATSGNIGDCDSQFKRLSDDISTLREFIAAEIAKKQSDTKSGEKLKDVVKILEETNFRIDEYDDVLTRHLIERISVKHDKTIFIKFKGGIEVVRSVE